MATLALPGTETTAVQPVDRPVDRRGGRGTKSGKAGPVTYTLLTLTARDPADGAPEAGR